ncbi:protein inturned isoform X2 [Aplysia californica]|uniref:Protein inturned n=1 Tax=Aplysia californica TaxID=6500 RepID=A0ABM1VRM0_APLCA|nr:protein inturned isoform X2 [Aplysia californica]
MLQSQSPDDRENAAHHWLHCHEDEEQLASSNELRKKTKEIQKLLTERNQKLRQETKDSNDHDNGLERLSVHMERPRGEGENKTNAMSRPRTDRDRQFKQITFKPNYRSLTGNESSGVEICKKLFGITIFEYSNGKSRLSNMTKDRKLVVQGVLEGSESHASGKIHRGDMLVRINDVSVSWLNFTKLLCSLKKRERVKLTFQSPRIVGPKSSYSVLQVPEADLCLAVLGKRLSHIQSELSQLNCAAMFLTLVPSEAESNEMEDIIYAFPPGEERLLSLRGLFITLSSSLVDVVGQPAACSRLEVNNGTVNVVYRQCGKDVFVLAMPEDRISLGALSNVMDGLYSLLVLLHSDLKRAFNECERTWLDKLLAVVFHQSLGLQSALAPLPLLPLSETAITPCHVVKSLQLSSENKLICDEILSETESMDFDDYLEQKDLFARRKYTVNGTCLFYKDYLVCSHLAEDLQRDVNLYLNCHGLLILSSRQHVDQVMVWQELKSRSEQDVTSLPAGYQPCDSRFFLMVIGVRNYYLCVVLEAGSCSARVEGQARPLSLMLDQGRATLSQLETREVHMAACCEDSLTNTASSVSLACADHLVTVTTPRNRSASRGAHRPPLTPTKSTDNAYRGRSKSRDRLAAEEDKADDSSNTSVMRRQGSKLSYGSNDSAGSGSSAGPPKSKSSRMSSAADVSSITRSLSVMQIEMPHDFVRGERLSRGRENTLFTYVHLDFGEGVLISPTDTELKEVHSALQADVLHHFCQACENMRSQFIAKRSTGFESSHKSSGQRPTSALKGEVLEQGCLFQVEFQTPSDKKRVSSLCYWVVGRCWREPCHQEMYVCFHESADQSLIEMAFSLGFGT